MLDTSDVLEVLSINLLGIVPEDENIIISTNRGLPVAFEERTPAGHAYGRIAQRLLGQDGPFAVFHDSNNLFGRVSRWFRGDQREP